jgi:hypothetical protein
MASKKSVDPLESAKLDVPLALTQDDNPEAPPPSSLPQKPSAAPQKVGDDDAQEKKAELAVEPVLPPPGKMAAAAESATAKKYRVKVSTTISWGASMIQLGAGAIVSDSLYGSGAIEKMKIAGVALEEVPD